jgi:hypothetical protein
LRTDINAATSISEARDIILRFFSTADIAVSQAVNSAP